MFSVGELRVLKSALEVAMRTHGETPGACAAHTRVVEELNERAAVQHMIETGRYPIWYRHKVRT